MRNQKEKPSKLHKTNLDFLKKFGENLDGTSKAVLEEFGHLPFDEMYPYASITRYFVEGEHHLKDPGPKSEEAKMIIKRAVNGYLEKGADPELVEKAKKLGIKLANTKGGGY